jgi:small subunit ribosomal protein S17
MELLPHEARRRTKLGTVVSDKMEETVVVAVESLRRHRLYGRSMRRTKKYHAHDAGNRCKVGDKVVIAESRPLSKTKHWTVREIVGHDVVVALPKVDPSEMPGPAPKIDPATVPPTPPRPRAAADEEPGGGVADPDEE